jgi:hypothetical protein
MSWYNEEEIGDEDTVPDEPVECFRECITHTITEIHEKLFLGNIDSEKVRNLQFLILLEFESPQMQEDFTYHPSV